MTIDNRPIDLHIEKREYLPFQEGLKLILDFLYEKIQFAKARGLGDDIYKKEVGRIEGMIRHVEEEFSENDPFIYLTGVSQESLGYLKTAALVKIDSLMQEKKNSGSVEIDRSIDSKIKEIKEDIEGETFKDVEPMEFYKDMTASRNKNKEGEQQYNIHNEEFIYNGQPKSRKQLKCFVILPIGKEETIERENNMAVYNKIIEPCVKSSGFNIHCYHADLIEKSGDISKQVIEALRDDDIVIADLRRSNPNVIYELGIRHTFGKRSILICSEQADHFFHTTKYRAVRYRIDSEPNQDFFQRLSKQIEDIIQNPEKFDNPITDILGYRTIDYAQKEKVKSQDKLYLSRVFKGHYSLGELYNPSDEDILDLNITLDFVDESNKYGNFKGRVINNFDMPLKATPFYPSVIKQKETFHITDFPRVAVKVIVNGKLATTREDYQQTFNVPPYDKPN